MFHRTATRTGILEAQPQMGKTVRCDAMRCDHALDPNAIAQGLVGWIISAPPLLLSNAPVSEHPDVKPGMAALARSSTLSLRMFATASIPASKRCVGSPGRGEINFEVVSPTFFQLDRCGLEPWSP